MIGMVAWRVRGKKLKLDALPLLITRMDSRASITFLGMIMKLRDT